MSRVIQVSAVSDQMLDGWCHVPDPENTKMGETQDLA